MLNIPSTKLRLTIPPTSPRRAISPGCPTTGWESVQLRKLLGRHSSFPDPAFTPATAPSQTLETSPSTTALAAEIEPGTYIAFAVSKDAIVEEYPEAAGAVDRFPTKRYVGLVSSCVSYKNDAGQLVQDLVVQYVSPPTGNAPNHRGRAVPIFPTTASAPASEASLRTGTLFPWANCKQWTTFGTRLLIERLYKSSLMFQLTSEGLDRFEDLVDLGYADAHLTSGIPESPEVQRLYVSDDPLPADIWMDVREANMEDAMKFPEEVHMLENLVKDIYEH